MNSRSRLFDTFSMRRASLKNRIVFGPHRTNLAQDHCISDRLVDYYARRAQGHVGMVVIEGASVDSSDYPYERSIFAYQSAALRGYENVARQVHSYGSVVVAQLNHCGCQADSTLSRREIWAPSAVAEVGTGEIAKPMEREDVEQVVTAFSTVASRLRGAGIDGIEVNAGQHSLLRQFLSPLTNSRDDEYGGSLENRARLCADVLRGVRDGVGADVIVGLRLCGDELAPWGGLTPDDCRGIAAHLCSAIDIDYLAVEVGGPYSVHMTYASMSHPQDYAVEPARIVAGAVDVPVCATGSIGGREAAEAILADGVSLVDMTRALIADPSLPDKLAAGADDDVRPCILCNQECYVLSGMNPTIGCAVNAEASTPLSVGRPPARHQRKVVVVGGGPAGLEAAVTAALRGHSITLCERRADVGGRVSMLARVPGRERYAEIVEYLKRQIDKTDVTMKLGHTLDCATLVEMKPDVVVLANGSAESPSSFPGVDHAEVWSPEAVLAGEARVGRAAVVVDREGGWRAVGAALALKAWAQVVTIVTPDLFVSSQLAKNGEFISWYQEAHRLDISFIPQIEVTDIENGCIKGSDVYSHETWMMRDIDTVVVAEPLLPDHQLYTDLLGKGIEVWMAGDCVAPRSIGAAIREGHRIGATV